MTIHKNKQNFNKQYDHLQAPVLVNKTTGRPKGSGTKKSQVEERQLDHPGCTKADCARETVIDPKTIRKWWK